MAKQAMFVKLTPAERAERESALAELDLQVVRLDREKRQWMDEHKEVRKPIEAKRLEICQELESGQRWVGVRFEVVRDVRDSDRPELQTQTRKRGKPKASEVTE